MVRKPAQPNVSTKQLLQGMIAALFLSSCTSANPLMTSDATGATEDQTIAAESSIELALEQADETRGRRLFLQCRACHSLEEGGINTVGPNLYGFFGREAGQVKGFSYSDVLAESGVVWTAETLDQWLARPGQFLPGNRMIFAGIDGLQDRADLILYLKRATGPTE